MVAYTQLAVPIDITPVDDDTYKDIDVTAHVTNASGVLVRILKVSSDADLFSFRKKGSTDTFLTHIKTPQHVYVAVGIDGNDVFQLSLQTSALVWEVDLIGYFSADDFVFFDNASEIITSFNVWSDFDISSLTGADTAIAAVCFINNRSNANRDVGFREKGSTDNRFNKVSTISCGGSPIVGVDVNEVFQVYQESDFTDLYCVGYAKSGVTMNTNAVNASISTTGAWTDLSPDLDAGAFVEALNTTTENEDWGIRPDGDTDFDFFDPMTGLHSWATVGAVGGIVEGQIESTNVDFFITGTIDADVGVTTRRYSLSLTGVG